MKKKIKELDFSNQLIFVGIDVHKKSWTVTIQIGGIKIKTFSMDPNPEQLSKHLKMNYPKGIYKTVYESGFSGYWIDRKLRSLGIENIIVNAADIPTSNKEKIQKTDKIDSRKLARELENENISGIYIPTEKQEALRTLSRLRMQLTKDQTRIKNRIKSLLYFLGVKFPEDYELKHWSGKFISYLSELELKHPAIKTTLDELIEYLQQVRKQLARVLKKLKAILRENAAANKILNYLETIPGVGFITAATLFTEIMDIKRFNKLDKLSAYVGLSPATHSSGEKEKVLGLSKRQNSFLRTTLIESSWIAVRNDPALTMAFSSLTQRMKKQDAIIRIAKKLLNRIMYVWRNEKEYVCSVVK